MSLRSPMGRVLGLGSARSGTEHWWAQRVSAIALLPLSLWFGYSLLHLGGLQYLTIRTWLARPLCGFLTILLMATLAYHSYLGTVVVIEDYVHSSGARLASVLALRFAHVLVGGVAIFAVIDILFGRLGA